MSEEHRIEQIFYDYETAGLVEGDSKKVLSFFADDLLGIGMGEQGFISSKKQVYDIMEATLRKDASATFSLEFQDVFVNMTSDKTASLCGRVYVKRSCEGETTTSGFMQSLSFVLRDGDWRICALHASPIMLTEESVESFPLAFADNTLSQLRGELKEDAFQLLSSSLSVGILGAYMEGHDLPPFYINDSLLHMLDYTQEEFLALMAENSFAVVHPEDQERAQREIAEAVEKGLEYTCQYRLVNKHGQPRWVVEHGKVSQQNGRAAILSAFVDVTELISLQRALEEKNETILSSISYASRIQKNLLPSEKEFQDAFRDCSILWSPKDIVGGDVYWLRRFEAGTVLCVADCTGHGIPGALLTVLVSTTLDNIVREENCHDPADILYNLDRRGAEILHCGAHAGGLMEIRDGCDIAVLFIAKDGAVSFSSAGVPVFLCDGQEVRRYRGQRFRIGEGGLRRPEQVETVQITGGRDHAFYVASDGLFDQIGGPGLKPFGYRAFQELVLRRHGEPQSVVSQEVWEAFEAYRGDQPRRDDMELLSFRP